MLRRRRESYDLFAGRIPDSKESLIEPLAVFFCVVQIYPGVSDE